VLAPDELPPVAEHPRLVGQQRLQVGLDAILDQPRIDPELVAGVVVDCGDRDDQLLAALVGHRPGPDAGRIDLLAHRAGRTHPVQGLVGPVVGVHRD
jgi:hypothetical protein